MKNNIIGSLNKWLLMPLLLLACTKGGDLKESNAGAYLLDGDGTAAQLVPALTHTGTSSFTGLLDTDVKTVTGTIRWNNLWAAAARDTIKSIRVLGPAAAGANGPLLASAVLQNTNASGTFTFSLAGTKQIGNNGIESMVGGNSYYVISTAMYPDGIVRGQINAEMLDPSKPAINLAKSIVFSPANKTLLTMGDTTTLSAMVLPVYVSNAAIGWSSSNPAIVSVDASGKIEAKGKGLATVTATAADGSGVKADLLIIVDMELKPLDRTGWTVTCSSEKVSDGGGKNMILDGNFGTYWHSEWSPNAPLPHWLLVDMQTPQDVAFAQIYRRTANTDTRTVVLELSQDGITFTPFGNFPDFDAASSASKSFAPTRARYMKLTITASNRTPFANITELNVGAYQ